MKAAWPRLRDSAWVCHRVAMKAAWPHLRDSAWVCHRVAMKAAWPRLRDSAWVCQSLTAPHPSLLPHQSFVRQTMPHISHNTEGDNNMFDNIFSSPWSIMLQIVAGNSKRLLVPRYLNHCFILPPHSEQVKYEGWILTGVLRSNPVNVSAGPLS